MLYGPRTAYRLRVSPAKPDFRAVAMPYSRHYQTGSSAWQGGTQAYDVFVHRIDGYTGAVTVTAEGSARGRDREAADDRPGGAVGRAGADRRAGRGRVHGRDHAEGDRNRADGKPLVREVRPASVTWGINTQQNQRPGPRAARSVARARGAAREGVLHRRRRTSRRPTTKVNGKDEKLAAPLDREAGREDSRCRVKVNWIAADKQNVTLAAEPMAQNPQANPVTVQIPTQPTKDKPEGGGEPRREVERRRRARTRSSLKGVAQVPFAKPDAGRAMAKGPNVPVE